MTAVQIVPVGPMNGKINVASLITEMNECQRVFEFLDADPLSNQPAPTMPRSDTTNDSRQYDPDLLAAYVQQHRGVHSHADLTIAIIDSEIYPDLFSTISQDNRVILISLRVPELERVLERSKRTFAQYVQLEAGAQILTAEYRIRANISADPRICAPPWHEERWDCLFDYYGLSPANVQKLMSPKISTQVLASFTRLEFPAKTLDAALAIVKKASRRTWKHVIFHLSQDPVALLIVGFVGGMLASIAANKSWTIWLVFVLGCLCLLTGRIFYLRTGAR